MAGKQQTLQVTSLEGVVLEARGAKIQNATYSRVLQLMNLTDGRLAQAACCDKLEMALLSFFEQFRKIYIGDQVQKTSKVYRRLSEVLGLNDEAMVLSVIIRKVSPLNLTFLVTCCYVLSTFTQVVLDLGRS